MIKAIEISGITFECVPGKTFLDLNIVEKFFDKIALSCKWHG